MLVLRIHTIFFHVVTGILALDKFATIQRQRETVIVRKRERKRERERERERKRERERERKRKREREYIKVTAGHLQFYMCEVLVTIHQLL